MGMSNLTGPYAAYRSSPPWTRRTDSPRSDEKFHEKEQKRENRVGRIFCKLLPEIRCAKPPRERVTDWNATWQRFGPLMGLFCIWLALSSLVTSFVILKSSDAKPTKEWSFRPSTYLAIATAIGNQAMRYAALQGVAIAWWSRALKGSTLAKLHRDWDIGTAVWSSLLAGKHTNILSLACLFSTLVAFDGPLLQRATNVILVPFNEPATLNLSLIPELPNGFSGSYSKVFNNNPGVIVQGNSTHYSNNETPSFADIVTGWSKKGPITSHLNGCDGSCQAKVHAPALAKTHCTRSTVPFNPPSNVAAAEAAKSLDEVLFYTDIGIVPSETEEYLNFTVLFREGEGCIHGQITRINCMLQSAIASYDVKFDGSVLTPNLQTVEILRLANNTARLHYSTTLAAGSTYSTLAGIASAAGSAFESIAFGWNDRNQTLQIIGFTGFVRQFLIPSIQDVTKNCDAFLASLAETSFKDPSDFILNELNDLMFRVGVDALATYNGTALIPLLDDGVSPHQTVSARHFGHHNVYHTNYWFFLAAGLFEMLCIFCVLPTYWGWWKLGRAVSFSPLEIAKAFEAPLLAECPSNGSGNAIAKAVENVSVRYGATGKAMGGLVEYEAKKIAFADPGVVYRPLDSFRFES